MKPWVRLCRCASLPSSTKKHTHREVGSKGAWTSKQDRKELLGPLSSKKHEAKVALFLGVATWALVKPGLTVARKSSTATPKGLVSIPVYFKNINHGKKKWTRVKGGALRSQV